METQSNDKQSDSAADVSTGDLAMKMIQADKELLQAKNTLIAVIRAEVQWREAHVRVEFKTLGSGSGSGFGFGKRSHNQLSSLKNCDVSLLSSMVFPMADSKAESKAESTTSTTTTLTKHLQDLEQNSSYNEHEFRHSENTQPDDSGSRTPLDEDNNCVVVKGHLICIPKKSKVSKFFSCDPKTLTLFFLKTSSFSHQ